MITDSGFEQGGVNWFATDPAGGVASYAVKSVAGQAQAGTHYMEASSVPAGSTVYQRVYTTPGTQAPGTTYRYTAWVRSPSCTTVNAYFTLWSAPSNTNSYILFNADCTWRQITTTFTEKAAGEVQLSPSISLNTAGVALDIDSASLVRVTYKEN